MPAKSLDDVYHFFQSKPIDMDDFDALYVDADSGRGGKPTCNRLKRRLANMPDENLKMLFAGYRGCGKSTELLRLQKQIQKDFVVIGFSVMQELDILNINYIELFITAMEKMFDFVKSEKKILVDPKYLENIKAWLKSVEIREISDKYMGMDIDTGIEAGVDIPFLAKFFGKFRASAKSSASLKQTLVTHVEPKLSDLLRLCNALIHEINRQLIVIGKKGLVLVIEDLDKLDIQKGEDIFYIHSSQLTQLECHCIFTFPIALLYHIRFKTIKDKYDETFVLPMIKVRERDGNTSEAGMDVIRRIVAQRMDTALFEKTAVLDRMIHYCGGCLWDLFRIVKDAADSALDEARNVITEADFKAAYNYLKASYEYTIAENPEKQITVEDYYEALKKCATSKTKKPDSSEVMLDLRNNLTVLNYNGENWADVHPIVRDILIERGLIRHDD